MANKRSVYDARHFATNDYQPQLTNWYEIQFTQGNSVNDDIGLVCQSCTLPESSNPVIEVGYGNSVAKIAGRREYGAGSFTFLDAMKKDTEKYFEDWQSRIFDPDTGEVGWVESYKCLCTVTQYSPSGAETWGGAKYSAPDRIWEFHGCWPSTISYGEMTGESADKKNIQVTMEYDYAKRRQ